MTRTVEAESMVHYADIKMGGVKYDINEAELALVALLKGNRRDRVQEDRFARAALVGFTKRHVTYLIKTWCQTISSNIYVFRTLPPTSLEAENLRPIVESLIVGAKLIELGNADKFQNCMVEYYGPDMGDLSKFRLVHMDVRTLWSAYEDDNDILEYFHHLQHKHQIPWETISKAYYDNLTAFS